MKLYRLIAASVLILIVIAGCTTTGTGRGEMTAIDKPAEPVLFSWESTDGGISGTMTAKLADATYTGQFFQVTQQTKGEIITPMWNGWSEGWSDWPYWSQPYYPGSCYGATNFITYYSGKVVANLEADNAQHMRCRFHLADPAGGMDAGGLGECQLSGGRLINATFFPLKTKRW